MKVTVLMSTYNGVRYLEEQIRSIRNQTIGYENIRIVIRDDASADRTAELIRDMKDSQITLIQGQNTGPAESFWELIRRCGTDADYYAFADQDDIWFSDKLERAVRRIQNQTAPVLYYSNVEIADAAGTPTGERLMKSENRLSIPAVMAGLPALGCTMVFNRAALMLFKNAKLTGIEMHDRTCFLIMYLRGKIEYDARPSMYYRQHSENVIGNQGRGAYSYWKKKLRHTYRLWFRSKSHDAVVQAGDMLLNYGNVLRSEDAEDLRRIVTYRRNLRSRRELLTAEAVKYLHPRVRRSCRIRIILNLF